MPLPRSFYERDTLTVARDLLGKILRFNGKSAVIVETEAYLGSRDKAAHTYKRKSERTQSLFGKKGVSYIYIIYGMYNCLNIATGIDGECVLIRALMDVDLPHNTYSGPGKLTREMGITREHNGYDLCDGIFTIEDNPSPTNYKITTTPRVGIDYAEEFKEMPWRFLYKDCPYTSKPKFKS